MVHCAQWAHTQPTQWAGRLTITANKGAC